jgi:hypothetical protein
MFRAKDFQTTDLTDEMFESIDGGVEPADVPDETVGGEGVPGDAEIITDVKGDTAGRGGRRMMGGALLKKIIEANKGSAAQCTKVTCMKEVQVRAIQIVEAQEPVVLGFHDRRKKLIDLEAVWEHYANKATYGHRAVSQKIINKLSDPVVLAKCGITGDLPPSLIDKIDQRTEAKRFLQLCLTTVKHLELYGMYFSTVLPEKSAGMMTSSAEIFEDVDAHLCKLMVMVVWFETQAADPESTCSAVATTVLRDTPWTNQQVVREFMVAYSGRRSSEEAHHRCMRAVRNWFSTFGGTANTLENRMGAMADEERTLKNHAVSPYRPGLFRTILR